MFYIKQNEKRFRQSKNIPAGHFYQFLNKL